MKRPVEGKNIVVIGAGIGGLSTGIILLLLNYNVTIVEKNPLPGGLMRSYRRSGIDCPVGVHYVGALGTEEPLGRIFRLLGISVNDLFERMGQDGVIDRYVFDSFIFDMPTGIDAYEQNLKTAFPGDAAAIDAIMNNLREIAGRMLDPSFLLSQGDPFQNIDYFNAMGDYLRKLNASDGLQAVLAMPAQLIGVPMAECPVIFHHMVLAGYLFSCWRLKESGSKMADIFARRFAELGGKLILSDGGEKILLEADKVAGLQLESGNSLPADAIVAAIHPKTMLTLLAPEALKSSYRQRVATLKETDGVIVVQVSIDARAHPEMSYNIYGMHGGKGDMAQNGMFCQLRRCNADGVNLLSIIAKSSYDEWSKWENTTSGKRGKDYEEKKLSIARDLLRQAGKILGNLKDPRILDVFTPLTLRDYVNCAEGSCYGLMRSSRQLLKLASLNNVPIPGLYLAGQNVVAPGVLGSLLGSFSVVRQIIGIERFVREIKWEA
ncbi:MAG: phytoene desaturase family protein [Smithellaceae bacterium]